jgi:hypothetical protein
VAPLDSLGVEDGDSVSSHPLDRQTAGPAWRGADAAIVEGDHPIPLRERFDLRVPAVAGDADALDAERGLTAASGTIGERDVIATGRSGHEGP